MVDRTEDKERKNVQRAYPLNCTAASVDSSESVRNVLGESIQDCTAPEDLTSALIFKERRKWCYRTSVPVTICNSFAKKILYSNKKRRKGCNRSLASSYGMQLIMKMLYSNKKTRKKCNKGSASSYGTQLIAKILYSNKKTRKRCNKGSASSYGMQLITKILYSH